MIDLHTHILHSIDDGARSLDASLVIARAALEDGIMTMAATPHGRVVTAQDRYSVDLVHTRVAELRAALANADMPLEIVAGTEIYGTGDVLANLRAGKLLTYGESRAVLVEFPSNVLRNTFEQIIFGLQVARYRVLVAHPERIRLVQEDPNTLIPLIERGALMQLTADALVGRQGNRLQRLAETLVRHNLVHVIASDSHGPHLERMPNMTPALYHAADLAGAAVATAMVRSTPAAILNDEPLDLPPPQRVKQRWRR